MNHQYARHKRWLLVAWVVILGPGGAADLLFAPTQHRGESIAVILVLAGAVMLAARFRPLWLAPGTAVAGVLMAIADPFEPGPMSWRVATGVADLMLAALGLWVWLARRREA